MQRQQVAVVHLLAYYWRWLHMVVFGSRPL